MTDIRERVAALAAPPDQNWFRIEDHSAEPRAEADPTSADVYVYGVIGGSWFSDGVTASDFAKQLADLDVDQINLYVNSPGGSVYEGIAMRAALQRHPANITAYVDSLAASAASFLITAANEVVMSDGADLMIHDALMVTYGNAADHADSKDYLDRISDKISAMYAKRAGGEATDWRALMVAETWYDAAEAVEAGLADRIADDEEVAGGDDAKNVFDLSMFAHKGREDAPRPVKLEAVAALRSTFPDPAAFLTSVHDTVAKARTKTPAEPGSSTTNTNQKGVDPMADLKKELANRLGLTFSDELTDEQILSATDEALAERAEPSATLPEGVVAVDKAVWEQTQAKAAQGADAFAAVEKQRREGIVNTALREGRITAESREKWLANLEKNEEGTQELLASLAPNTVLNTVEHGTTGGATASSDEDRTWNTFYGTTDAPKED